MLLRAFHITNDISILSMVPRFHQHHLFLYLFYMDWRLHRSLLSPWRCISLILRHYGGIRASYHCWPRHLTGQIFTDFPLFQYLSDSWSLQFSLASIRFSTLISLRLSSASDLIAHLLLSLSPSVSLPLTKMLENHKNTTPLPFVFRHLLPVHTPFSSSAVLEPHFCCPR